MNKHPEKIKLTVVNRYLNGEQISKITRDINISRTTAYAWIKQHNNSFNKGKAPNFRYLHDLEQKCERQQKIIEILKRSPYLFRCVFHRFILLFRFLNFLNPKTGQEARGSAYIKKHTVSNTTCMSESVCFLILLHIKHGLLVHY